jgi:hypothetical protein
MHEREAARVDDLQLRVGDLGRPGMAVDEDPDRERSVRRESVTGASGSK